jgi:hypothetical protein
MLMSIDWFRSWHGAPTDPKWLAIARRANVLPGIVSAVAWALYDHASKAKNRGDTTGFDPETYAAFSGFEEQHIRAVVTALLEKKLILPDGRLAIWDEEQKKYEDPTAAERKRKQRDRDRDNGTGSGKDGNHDPSQNVTDGHKLSQNVTLDSDSESEIDEEGEDSPLKPPEGGVSDTDFETLFAAYPSGRPKGNKETARKIYRKLISKGETHANIMAGNAAYRIFCEAGNYNQHLSTWLSQRGWETNWVEQLGSAPRKPFAGHERKSPAPSVADQAEEIKRRIFAGETCALADGARPGGPGAGDGHPSDLLEHPGTVRQETGGVHRHGESLSGVSGRVSGGESPQRLPNLHAEPP